MGLTRSFGMCIIMYKLRVANSRYSVFSTKVPKDFIIHQENFRVRKGLCLSSSLLEIASKVGNKIKPKDNAERPSSKLRRVIISNCTCASTRRRQHPNPPPGVVQVAPTGKSIALNRHSSSLTRLRFRNKLPGFAVPVSLFGGKAALPLGVPAIGVNFQPSVLKIKNLF